MKRWMRLLLGLLMVLAAGCEYEEVKRETGYKGKARINPWLAAERFAAERGHTVRSLASWKNPDWNDSVCFVSIDVLNNEGFIRQMNAWVEDGGHLVLLADYSQPDQDDWRLFNDRFPQSQTGVVNFLKAAGFDLQTRKGGGKIGMIPFNGRKFEVDSNSSSSVKTSAQEEGGAFASEAVGGGRISVVTDSRIFRNRWIGEHDHAALLGALIDVSEYEGAVTFIRGSGLSLWSLLDRHLRPFLIGLGVLLVIWLWKNFSRFGPLEAAQGPSLLRGYDHHLEALGDFQWRLDQGAALLAPLREQIVEEGQRQAMKAGRRDDDFFQFLADRVDLPRERVVRALTEAAPGDAAVMTRTAADLQRLLTVV